MEFQLKQALLIRYYYFHDAKFMGYHNGTMIIQAILRMLPTSLEASVTNRMNKYLLNTHLIYYSEKIGAVIYLCLTKVLSTDSTSKTIMKMHKLFNAFFLNAFQNIYKNHPHTVDLPY